jgi:hypothetical protein
LDGKFKILGIKYDLNKTEFWADNFKEKIMVLKTSRNRPQILHFVEKQGFPTSMI